MVSSGTAAWTKAYYPPLVHTCVFLLWLRLQFTHCLNSQVPIEFGHFLSVELSVPLTLIPQHRRLHCDQRRPLKIIYQLLWSSLPAVILWPCWKWILLRGPTRDGIHSNILCTAACDIMCDAEGDSISRKAFCCLSSYRGHLIKNKLCC